ncbi:MAG TPA: FGGY-family carbohydrate kinase [Clostridiales bacterium]|nr:FGGY-family carbohydrate kinase [Clostridiales bacterium]
MNNVQSLINFDETVLGIELGSTRIKAVLIGPDHLPVASGSHNWENRFENNMWTYHLEDVWTGLQDAYAELAEDVRKKYGQTLTRVKAIGISGMMHGYLPFDKDGNQLAEFRTWRNTNTEQAAPELTQLLEFNIPHRWSIAHLYQAILNGEKHVKDIDFLTTLAGYVHWKLTGEKVLGVGEASGMFPIDSTTIDYNSVMVSKFDNLLKDRGLPFKLLDILPKVKNAGEFAGALTAEGAKLLDPTGGLQPGIPFCPPEGDAQTGMVATNSVAPRTGNVSAGTSIFAMIVLEKPLSKVYTEVDMVTTPSGSPVAMVHSNTCTSDLDAWVRVFGELVEAAGAKLTKPELYDLLYYKALEGDADCGGLVSFNYYSGEPIAGIDGGRPLFVRKPDAKLTLANFMRAHLFSSMAILKIGMDILEKENVALDRLFGHGGLFKTKGVGQKLMSSALNVPVAVLETAGEGGPWGMALLAAYMANKNEGETLESYLEDKVFKDANAQYEFPDPRDNAGFAAFLSNYKACLPVEQAAVDSLK